MSRAHLLHQDKILNGIFTAGTTEVNRMRTDEEINLDDAYIYNWLSEVCQALAVRFEVAASRAEKNKEPRINLAAIATLLSCLQVFGFSLGKLPSSHRQVVHKRARLSLINGRKRED